MRMSLAPKRDKLVPKGHRETRKLDGARNINERSSQPEE